MENRTSYTIVGAFVMACVFALTAFVWWMLTRTDTRETYRSYYIHTKELPTGIRENSDVKFIGVNAGIIKKIDFVDIENAIIEIEVSLKSKLPISRDSIAKVETQGISGISFLNITKGSGELFSENEEKPIIELDKTLLDKIGSKAEVITDSVGQMIFKINSLLSQDNMKKVDEILTSLNKFSAELSDEKKFNELNSLMENMNKLIVNLNDREHELDEILDKFNAFASSATRLSNSLEKTSQIMAKRVERGEYNLKAILDPTLNEAKTTLSEFNKALREFQGAMFRLEENPYEFFFRDTKKD